MTLAGYQLREFLHQGPKSIVYRATRLADGGTVILKTSTEERPEPRRVAELRHEYAISSRLSVPGVARALSLVEFGGRPALELEDIGAISLRQYVDRQGRLSVERCIDVVLQLSQALAEIHRSGVVHKDIKPQNIVIKPDTGTVQLIDFSIASELSREDAMLASPRNLEGTLPYMAPEQTGRMNRGIDHRADFYSLGVTFYELLSGRLPFEQQVPIEIVHAHIAVVPPPVHELAPGLPRALSAIVARLLAKNAEERYQSAHGIIVDLRECHRQLRERGSIGDDFAPARHDRTEFFQLPQKLYGRDEELTRLSEAFERVRQGGSELLLVVGQAGVGKSALVNEIQKGITRHRGFFIAGKFDQRSRTTPYEPVAHAFRSLVQQILTEPPEVLADWRQTLMGSLGGLGQVLVDLIPEIGFIIGPQPPVLPLPPKEAQNRFALAFQSFIRVFATPEHPLVLFLDDLQWVDAASLNLLEFLLTGPDSKHMLVVGTYRDNEVTAAHPLVMALQSLAEGSATISAIKVAPLTYPDVEQLVADSLGCAREQAASLSQPVFDKTHGNPFFVGQFLRSLYDEKLLTFDAQRGTWTWEARRIIERRVTDNVVDFMASKLRRLPSRTQGVLQFAACIGHEFDLRTLAVIRESHEREVAEDLWDALREGLVVPLDVEYRYLHPQLPSEQVPLPPPSFDVSFRFLHDRVQQAAYSFIEDTRRKEVHLRIGRLMLTRANGTQGDDELFDIADHLNFGAQLIEARAERMQLARLNLAAGRRAKSSTAYQAAANYLRAGMEMLGESCWEREYELAFALHLDRAESEYLSGNFARAETFLDTLLDRAHTRREWLQVQTLRIILAITPSRFADAIAAGTAGAARFGIIIPESDEARRAALEQELAEVQQLLASRKAADLLDAPVMTDPELRELSRLMIYFNSAAWFVSPSLFGLVAAKQVGLALRHGHSDLSALGYCFYGMLLAAGLSRHGEAYEFGTLAIALNERFCNAEIDGKIEVLFTAFMNFWRRPLKSGVGRLRRAYQATLEVGDFVYTSYACDQTLFIHLATGEPLPVLREEVEKFFDVMQRTKNHVSLEIHRIVRQVVANLEGRTRERLSLADDTFTEEGYAEHLSEKGHHFPASFYYTSKLQLAYMYGEPRLALELALTAEKHIRGGGLFYTKELVFFTCLTLIQLMAEAEPEQRASYEAMLSERRKRLETWTDECASNFLHKKLLVDAEVSRLNGNELQALDAYERAIDAARENDFPHQEALANELCARFHLECGRHKLARFYMREAIEGYRRWGASSKVQELFRRYPELTWQRGLTTEPLEVPLRSAKPPGYHTPSSTRDAGALDLTSLMKASAAIASEIVMERLLSLLVQIMVENAGAEQGSLLLLRDGELFLEAQAQAGGRRSEPGRSVRLADAQNLCEAMVRYVWRTQEPVVIADAQAAGRFQRDPYIQQRKVRSALCAPIRRHGELTGILYLENNLLQSAFTPARLQVLELLSAQAAISLENARLYETLEQRVKERTRELHRSNRELSQMLERLQATQRQLVVQEKLASLGALTAGIAHEIKNPLNFVNNFAEASVELTEGLLSILGKEQSRLDPSLASSLEELATDLKQNAMKIAGHGHRADRIIKAMLEHSRGGTGEKREVDLNALIAQYVHLAWEGRRLQLGDLRARLETNYDPSLPLILLAPQEFGRVVLNLVSNALYAMRERRKHAGAEYEPVLRIATQRVGDSVEVRVRDNGTGIAASIRDRIFLPFFTTKPSGDGTGLGLSISYDIIVQGNGGELRYETEEGKGTEFIVSLNMDTEAAKEPTGA